MPTKNHAHTSANTDGNPATSRDEINAAAKKAGIFTPSMLAAKLGITEGTVRNRLDKIQARPVAKIHPKSRGRATLAYDAKTLEAIENIVGEVVVEQLNG